MSKCKPCPFCGEEAVIYERTKLDGSSPFFRYSVGCGNRYCEIRPQTGFWKHQSEAMYSWNRRTSSRRSDENRNHNTVCF